MEIRLEEDMIVEFYMLAMSVCIGLGIAYFVCEALYSFGVLP